MSFINVSLLTNMTDVLLIFVNENTVIHVNKHNLWF